MGPRQLHSLLWLAPLALALTACPPPAPTCDAGASACGTTCADLSRDEAHCGQCGTSCSTGQSCVTGACFDNDCAGLECNAAAVCKDQRCVESACLGVSCPSGERCVAGECEPSVCTDAQCPEGSVCRNDACVDVSCDVVVCPTGQACSQGACYPRSCAEFDCNLSYACIQDDCLDLACQGVVCPQGRECLQGICRPTSCGGIPCPAQSVCIDELCVDTSCLGVICPANLECLGGQCGCVPGTNCAPVNECLTDGICGPNTVCTDTTSSFDCACAPGFTGTPTTGGVQATCTDIDECQTSGLCGANTLCGNAPPGSYTCACASGYFGASVIGGPATCSNVDRCAPPTNCGANAICNTTPSSYTCTCAPGFTGTQTTGAPASCTDTNECADAGGACGPYASCTNTTGSYLCNCVPGASGSPTDGGPASCGPVLTTIGVNTGISNSFSITLSRPLDAGVHLVLVGASENSFSVSDTRANTWIRAVQSSGCADCAYTAIHHSTLSTPLAAGDRITLQGIGSVGAAWVFSSEKYLHLDTIGGTSTSNQVTAFSVTGSSAVTNSDELVVAGFATEASTALTPDGGATVSFSSNSFLGSSLLEYKAGPGLSGAQSLSGQANPAAKVSGVLASFYGGPRIAPTGLSLTHSPRRRDFVVNWTGGRGNGGPTGCSVRYLDKTGVSKLAGNNLNCDANTSQTVTLPTSSTWYGGAWSNVTVQLVRNSDGALLGTFAQRLTCTSTTASNVPTTSIDEDCDGDWDDHTCANWTWVRGTIYGTSFSACTNASDTTTSKACGSTNEAEVRYTQGQGTTQTPAQVFSSASVGTACSGPDTGAVQWTCTGSACSYR